MLRSLALTLVLMFAPSAAAQQDMGRATPATAEPKQSLEEHLVRLAQRHMRTCWALPNDDRVRGIVGEVEFELNEDGSLLGQPRVISPTNYLTDAPESEAVSRALQAVRRCSPFPFASDPVAAANYEWWRRQSYRFRAPID